MPDSAKTVIDIPSSDVWARLIDVAEWPQWMPGVRAVPYPPQASNLLNETRIEVEGGPPGQERFIVVEQVDPPNRLVLRRDVRPFFQLMGFLTGTSVRSITLTWRVEPNGTASDISVTAYLDQSLIGLLLGGWLFRLISNGLNSYSRSYRSAFVKYLRSFARPR